MSAKLLIIFSFMVIIAGGCLKTDQPDPCTPKTVDSEMAAMTKFAADSSIITTQDGSGYYTILLNPAPARHPARKVQ